jgi:Ca2+-binding EF-hand superfamily protein
VRTILLTLTLLGLGVAQAQTADDMVTTLFAYDANKDGKLSKEELPERMQGIFARADTNKDGFLTKDEVRAAMASQQPRRMEGGGERGGPPMDMLFRAIDKNGDGILSKEEIANASAALQTLDKNGDGQLTQDEVRPQMRGGGRGGNPQEMISRMFEENDKNHDGKLSKAEMPERMAEMFDRADTNGDGFLTKEELGKLFETMGGRRRE